MSQIQVWSKALVTKPWFSKLVLALIIINAITIGLETYPAINGKYGWWLHVIDASCLSFFVIEIALKVIAAKGFKNFFSDNWDTFDFVIVSIALIPYGIQEANIARIFRLLRVLRTITFMPQLRLLITTLLKTLPSLINIVILLSLLFYFYAVMGSVFFAEHMPDHFGNMGNAALTLFGIVTLEGWIEVMAEASELSRWAWIYFLSFILLGTFIIVNLFVAVVVSNLEQTFRELEAAELAKGISDEQLTKELQKLYANQRTLMGELEILLVTKQRIVFDLKKRSE